MDLYSTVLSHSQP